MASFPGDLLGFGDIDRSAAVGDGEAEGLADIDLRADERGDELHLARVLNTADCTHLGDG